MSFVFYLAYWNEALGSILSTLLLWELDHIPICTSTGGADSTYGIFVKLRVFTQFHPSMCPKSKDYNVYVHTRMTV